jgi:hypothetical protein
MDRDRHAVAIVQPWRPSGRPVLANHFEQVTTLVERDVLTDSVATQKDEPHGWLDRRVTGWSLLSAAGR